MSEPIHLTARYHKAAYQSPVTVTYALGDAAPTEWQPTLGQSITRKLTPTLTLKLTYDKDGATHATLSAPKTIAKKLFFTPFPAGTVLQHASFYHHHGIFTPEPDAARLVRTLTLDVTYDALIEHSPATLELHVNGTVADTWRATPGKKFTRQLDKSARLELSYNRSRGCIEGSLTVNIRGVENDIPGFSTSIAFPLFPASPKAKPNPHHTLSIDLIKDIYSA